MESFPEASGRLLREFKLQLSHRPLLVSAERLLHISAVNMFSVDNAVPRGRSDSRVSVLLQMLFVCNIYVMCGSLIAVETVQRRVFYFSFYKILIAARLGKHLSL